MIEIRKVPCRATHRHALAAVITGLVTGFAAGLGCSPAVAEKKPPAVVVTIKPVHSLVSMVMEGIGKPVLLIDGVSSPHSYALKPSDARALNGADVVIRIADVVEPFTRRIAETLPGKTTLVTLADVKGMQLWETRTGTTFEPHDHDAVREANEGEQHAHGHDHDAGAVDGHIWLDPTNAKTIVRSVADVLAKKRPDLKNALSANVTAALARLDALDAELKEQLSPVKGEPFVVFHDAYQYFERHYNLHAAGAITLNPEVAPSARRLTEIRATIKKSGAHCVFAEPQFSPRIINAVVEGSEAKAGVLDPLGSTIEAGSDQYGALMRSLGTSIRDCLGSLG